MTLLIIIISYILIIDYADIDYYAITPFYADIDDYCWLLLIISHLITLMTLDFHYWCHYATLLLMPLLLLIDYYLLTLLIITPFHYYWLHWLRHWYYAITPLILLLRYIAIDAYWLRHYAIDYYWWLFDIDAPLLLMILTLMMTLRFHSLRWLLLLITH
jgi:hypothetical protein